MRVRLVDDELLTVREVASELRITVFTVYRLMRNKRNPLPHMRIGRSIRIPRNKLLQWIKRQPVVRAKNEPGAMV